MEMVNGSERGTKRKSKRLRPSTSTSKADNDNNDTKVTIRKSSRLISSLEVKKCTSLATTPEVNIMENGKNLRPSRQQYLLLPTELRCADISHKTSIRLGVQSCFCCDNFRLDKVFLANDATQENVSAKKYGCRRKERIKVSVKYSHRHSHTTSHPKIIQEYEIIPVSEVPQKPSSTVKRKLAQWRRFDFEKKINAAGDNVVELKKSMEVEKVIALKKQKMEAEKKVKELTLAHKETVKKIQRKNYHLTKQNKELTEKLSSGNLPIFVNEVLKRMHFKNRASLVLELVFLEKCLVKLGSK